MNSIVVGSGFGGIAAALRLKAKGHQVTLVENILILVVEQEFLKKMVSLTMVDPLLLPHPI